MLELDQDHNTCLRKKGELLQLHLERLSRTARVWPVQKEYKGSKKLMLYLKRM